MFKHLLLPTDGSPLFDFAVRKGIALGRALGAKVTGLHVIPVFHVLSLRAEALQGDQAEFAHKMRLHADQHLSKLASLAAQANVPCDTLAIEGDHPYQAIIDAAMARQCDLIVMASHGRKGIQALLLGSETQKVLTHTKTPVMVFHPED